jgi:hypothetical protein
MRLRLVIGVGLLLAAAAEGVFVAWPTRNSPDAQTRRVAATLVHNLEQPDEAGVLKKDRDSEWRLVYENARAVAEAP